MKQTFEFLTRFPQTWHGEQTLLILDEDASGLPELTRQAPDLEVLALHQHNHEQAKALDLTSHVSFDLRGSYQRIIIDWPKAKRLGEMLVDFAQSLLVAGGEILIIGSNKGGIKSVAKRLASQGISATKQASANHCVLLSIAVSQAKAFSFDPWWHQYQHDGLTISALPGVFSAQKLDRASALLLAQLPELSGDVLDFGCGAGVLGLSVAKRSPDASVTLLDNSVLAVMSARRSAEDSGLSNLTIIARNGLSQYPRARFRHVVTNPPFHEGLRTKTNMSRGFLADMAKIMHLKGQVWVVANEFLAYETTLAQYFKSVKAIAKQDGFKVIGAQYPIIQRR